MHILVTISRGSWQIKGIIFHCRYFKVHTNILIQDPDSRYCWSKKDLSGQKNTSIFLEQSKVPKRYVKVTNYCKKALVFFFFFLLRPWSKCDTIKFVDYYRFILHIYIYIYKVYYRFTLKCVIFSYWKSNWYCQYKQALFKSKFSYMNINTHPHWSI